MARKAPPQKDGDDEGETAAAGRGLWSGSISFGLLQIPVTLHTAERRAEEIHFRQLDKKDLAPIRYERVSSATGKAVAWKDIVKGYEYEPDTFVVIEPEELKEAAVKATQTLDIQDFVPADQIDPAFFETPYYVVPQKRSAKAYVLLREALKKKRAVAVATFVLRTKEHLAALMPVGDAIMLEVLRYGHELRPPKDLPLPKRDASIGDRELAMAEQLIDGMMTAWEPSRYKDRYHGVVLKMIEEKAKTGAITRKDKGPKGAPAGDAVDLLELLRKSLAKTGDRSAHANDAGEKKPRKTASKKPRRSPPRSRAA
ncbi:MAG TPA: Ku protein [Labilithrix sp.]|nr:Ku protein [Labilithrix sp.]